MAALDDSQLSSSARAQRRAREACYQSGSRQRKFSVRPSVVARIDELKAREGLPNRDVTVARLLRKASALYEPSDVLLAPPAPSDEKQVAVVAMLALDLIGYVDDVRAGHRHVTVGRVLESVLGMIPNLDPVPQQITMAHILGESAVSG